MNRQALQRGISTVLLVAALAGCAGAADKENAASTPDPAEVSAAAEKMAEELLKERLEEEARAEARASASAEAEAAAAAPPPPEAFTIGITLLEKKCFGSAGCNVTFRIDPTYTGTGSVEDVEVTYEVVGGEDPLINTFTVDSAGTASFPEQESIQTASEGTELSVQVLSVRRAP